MKKMKKPWLFPVLTICWMLSFNFWVMAGWIKIGSDTTQNNMNIESGVGTIFNIITLILLIISFIGVSGYLTQPEKPE